MRGELTERREFIRPPQGVLCYRVVTWRVGAVEQEQWERVEAERRRLVERMQDMAVSGRKGERNECEENLNALNLNVIQNLFDFRAHAALALTRVRGLRESVRSDSAVLGYRFGEGAMCVWLELVDERSPEEHLCAWMAANPEVEWSGQSIISQHSAQEVQAELDLLCKGAEQNEETEIENQGAGAPYSHVTVLAREAVEALQPSEGKVIVDATLGGGGHSELLLEAGANVWGIDRDPVARAAARGRLARYGERLHIVAGNFGNIRQMLSERGVQEVDGVLADIGVSSPQVDTPERGFSFRADGPLDMRMDPMQERTAADIVNEADEGELAEILWQYGEERSARAIARRIVQQRKKSPIRSTMELAKLISTVLPRKGKLHPATRSFQALRIAVNDELGELQRLLEGGYELLCRGGRMAVVTFHSLEDRAVKQFFAQVTTKELDRPEWAEPRPNPAYGAKLITRKPIRPGKQELTANARARSAKLRVIEKI